ncbi:disulfide bond formation protein B [Allorhizobium borbori]|uniref:Disulfide bond formation protein DsbB n=1 Tax=Allorhizobium borbori TaxID=485907 RepID=A0A7W6K5U2_9HYPH|nr:disulfide bond formation protein B [Allorhizobium borbori]MBB4105670.1 disulfide bond formation protein DsbB [Allorhizobium borbori]PZU18992.1 MAG: disulfide bond formation protein B [Shinella sp.]
MLLSRECLFSRTGLATLLTLGFAGTVGSALGFEHIGGYIPCALCLIQRIPFYIAVPVGILTIAASRFGAPAWASRGLFVILGLIMLVSAGLGVYHAGVEWQFWAGPAGCSTSVNAVTMNANDLLGDLNRLKPPSCSEASLRVLGLSFAGWNVIASLVLAAIAFFGARKTA